MRISCWWHYKAAPLMAFIYAKAYINAVSPLGLLPAALVFFIAVIGIAGLGHFINDWADIEEDTISGKENFAAGLSPEQRVFSGFFLFLLCVLPWFYLYTDPLILGLLILELLLFLAYSIRPVRLKNRHIWGIAADTLYGHIVPALVVLAVFSYYGEHRQMFAMNNTFTYVLVLWLICKGSRNIILHQIDDRKKDKTAGINTFVVKHGGVFALNLINRLILPLEFLGFAALLYFARHTFSYFYIPFAAFIVFTIVKFSLWKVFVLPTRQMRFKFLYFLNDYYEDWLPLTMLVYLSLSDMFFVFYLIIHLVLFPRTMVNFVRDLKHIITR